MHNFFFQRSPGKLIKYEHACAVQSPPLKWQCEKFQIKPEPKRLLNGNLFSQFIFQIPKLYEEYRNYNSIETNLYMAMNMNNGCRMNVQASTTQRVQWQWCSRWHKRQTKSNVSFAIINYMIELGLILVNIISLNGQSVLICYLSEES